MDVDVDVVNKVGQGGARWGKVGQGGAGWGVVSQGT